MLISALIVTGGIVTLGSLKYQTNGRKRRLIETISPTQEHERKTRFSLYDQIITISRKLKLDQIVPISHRTKHPLFKTSLSPWEEKEITSGQLAGQITRKKEYSIRDDLRLFRHYISKYWRPYWGVALFSGASLLVFGLYQTTFAYALKVIIDGVGTAGGLAVISPILQALLISFPVVVLATIVGERVSARLGSRIVKDIQYDIFAHLQRLSPGFYKKAKLGDILARFSSDMLYVRMGMGTQLLPGVVDLLTLSVSIAFMFWLSWQMALISLLSLPVMAYVLREFSPRVAQANFALKNQEALMIHAVQEGVRAQPVIKSFNTHPFMQDCFLRELNKLEDQTTESLFSRAMFESSSVISLFSAQLISVSAGLLLLGGGYLSVGALVSYMVAQMTAHQNIRQLFRNRLHSLIMTGVGLRRVDLLFRNQAEIVDAPAAIKLPAFHQAICFDKVSFGYTKTHYQLNQVDFSIESGQFVAFVGPSGAGKSTLFNLLLRFYEVGEGRVTVDGVDVRDVTQASLRQQMGIVLQETFIFNTSILNNIRIVRPDATKAEVIRAAQAAELHDFIMTLSEGYETNAGEAGGRLSGGQKQRIAMARAMLCNPAILVLDEATSSLDAETAAAVDATIYALSKERTVISISHHLRSIIGADKIFVLDQGHIVEQGTHQDLLAIDGLYAQLWHAQMTSG